MSRVAGFRDPELLRQASDPSHRPWRPCGIYISVFNRFSLAPPYPPTFFSLPQMSRRKADDTSDQLATKRTRRSAPVFRVARAPATISRTSRVTVIRTGPRGRRGYSTEDKVYSPVPLVDQQPEADLPQPDLDNPSPLQPSKPKRTRENTTSVSFPSPDHRELNS
jgi:hypothetical protein